LKAADAARIVSAEIVGDASLDFCSVATATDADASSIIFLEQEKYLAAVQVSLAGVVITAPAYVEKLKDKTLLVCEKPYIAILTLVAYLQKLEMSDIPYEIDASAKIGSGCEIAEDVSIGANVVIGKNCKIGSKTIIGANCVLGDNCILGEGCHLFPNVNVYEDSIL
ncbi:MAG: LpxD N-terminal domain-containing protein, partial [Candidatus Cloacimonadaceae bacterium]|nr:LpxD N-terminal domain-containing protein [Candidatus Cloacimonadaceae bacterium]